MMPWSVQSFFNVKMPQNLLRWGWWKINLEWENQTIFLPRYLHRCGWKCLHVLCCDRFSTQILKNQEKFNVVKSRSEVLKVLSSPVRYFTIDDELCDTGDASYSVHVIAVKTQYTVLHAASTHNDWCRSVVPKVGGTAPVGAVKQKWAIGGR